ncbi:quinon protein alcohol dehydrogenase-like superfamily [Papiliotrema laurentii]|uniref:Quinon protein alcohol dehydrogenase-like superfamily n=1 Tax=Papiliotrema laurentii TaxID=5418 RepID=A0AAD9FTV2_PAPLA|nr:quinon protein alcohol dehydrogenase-like superfamily [Papiliotrema laurentii]
MTRTSHKAHPTPQFPVYCLDWADDEVLILGGGGGATKSGIHNKLKQARIAKDGRKVKYISEIKLSSEEDAPMTIAVDRASKQLVTGINASSSSIQQGTNEQCRLYSYADDKFELKQSKGTIKAEWSDDYPYQKLTAISPDSRLVAVGTTDNQVSVLSFPSLEVATSTINVDSELVDLDWGGSSGQWLAVATTASLLLYQVTLDNEKVQLQLRQTIYPPSVDITAVSFRAARFSPSPASSSPAPTIHAVVNSTRPPKRGAPRKAFVVTFGLVAGPSSAPLSEEEKKSHAQASTKGKEKEQDVSEGEELGRWDVLVRREVAGKPITVFDVSADGKLLAYGSADLSIGILDSKTLAPLLKILHAHSFPPTALKFNPSANLLVSASADNTIRAIVVPASFAGVSGPLITILIALLVLLIALFYRP